MSNEVFALLGQVITANEIIVDGAVVVAGDAIAWAGPSDQAQSAGFGEEVAAGEKIGDGYILPGLVDVHCHGGGGASFPDAQTKEQAMTAIMEHRRYGTTSLVGSLVTASPMVLKQRCRLLTELCEAGELAGVHFEGPFVAQGHCGAQNPAHIQVPNPALVKELLELCHGYGVSMTFAPEKPFAMGKDGVAQALLEGGAVPSLGHTDTDAAKMRSALIEVREMITRLPKARSRHATITHLFNGMEPMHHRQPGPVPEALADAAGGGVIVELIGDGVHLAPSLVNDVYELVGRDQLVLVTDAMEAAGMPDGTYVLGGQEVEMRDGQARLTKNGSLAGGTSHLLDQIAIVTGAGIPLLDAVYCASVQGAKVLGDDTVGQIAAGKRADLIVTDAELKAKAVYFRGQLVEA